MRVRCRGSLTMTAVVVLLAAGCTKTVADEGAGGRRSAPGLSVEAHGGSTQTYVPMTFSGSLEYDPQGRSAKIGCQTNDAEYDFSASGSLNPGESFTFIIMPTCAGWNEAPVVATQLTWDASQIELSTQLPAPDVTSGTGLSDIGLPLVARPVGNESHLCVFLRPEADPTNRSYVYPAYLNLVDTGAPWSAWASCTSSTGTCTEYGDIMGVGVKYVLRNTGTATAYKVKLTGHQSNGWPVNWSQWSPFASWNGANLTCARADGDGDGWNDGIEQSLFRGGRSWSLPGTSFARALPAPADPSVGTAVATYPPDFNDDGVVDQADLGLLTSFVGQGDGIPYGYLDYYWETGHPVPPLPPGVGNSACAPWYLSTCEAASWRRFDLNDDGYVDQKDVGLEDLVIGKPYPLAQDILPPSVRFWSPWNGGTLTAGAANQIATIATDNKWLSRVDLFANGKKVGSSQNGTLSFTPRSGSNTLEAIAYDGAGNSASATITVSAQ